MAEILISQAEKVYILHGVQEDLRSDGRGRLDYRSMEIETNIVSHANGSARIRLAQTDILATVKVELASPLPLEPDRGIITFFVDCSANATPEFEGRGGEDLAVDISRTLTRAYISSKAFDLTQLCVIPGTHCWILHVDILILECGGNLYDAASIAVKAALFNTQIPSISINSSDAGSTEIELSDDPYAGVKVQMENVPCLLSFNKIGNNFVIDPSPEEEACSQGILVIGYTPLGQVCAIKKSGMGSFTSKTVNTILEVGVSVAKSLHKALIKLLQEEEEIPTQYENRGFLR